MVLFANKVFSELFSKYFLSLSFFNIFFFLPLQLVLKNEVTLYYNPSPQSCNSSGGNVFKILKVLFGFATGVRFLPILLTKEYFWNNSGWSKQQTLSCFSYFWSVEYDAGDTLCYIKWRIDLFGSDGLSELSVQSK